jgi:hypothetical protein
LRTAAVGAIQYTSTSKKGSSSGGAGKYPPEWEKWARKDIFRVGPGDDSLDSVEVAIRFREFAGTYMEHCHKYPA